MQQGYFQELKDRCQEPTKCLEWCVNIGLILKDHWVTRLMTHKLFNYWVTCILMFLPIVVKLYVSAATVGWDILEDTLFRKIMLRF